MLTRLEYQKEMPQFFQVLVDKSVEKRGITLEIGGELFTGFALRRYRPWRGQQSREKSEISAEYPH